MGLDVYLYDGAKRVEEDDNKSDLHPDHYWNKGYLRSSYNDGGFNSVVGNLLGRDLSWVFEPIIKGDDYRLVATKTGLRECRERAIQLRDQLALEEGFRVITANIFGPQPTLKDDDAMRLFKAELIKKASEPESPFGGGYSNRDGSYYLGHPIEVLAAIPGRSALGSPAIHLICKMDLTFYREASDILIEFIDRALACKRPILHWSS
jgi:hypothetical protein